MLPRAGPSGLLEPASGRSAADQSGGLPILDGSLCLRIVRTQVAHRAPSCGISAGFGLDAVSHLGNPAAARLGVCERDLLPRELSSSETADHLKISNLKWQARHRGATHDEFRVAGAPLLVRQAVGRPTGKAEHHSAQETLPKFSRNERECLQLDSLPYKVTG